MSRENKAGGSSSIKEEPMDEGGAPPSPRPSTSRAALAEADGQFAAYLIKKEKEESTSSPIDGDGDAPKIKSENNPHRPRKGQKKKKDETKSHNPFQPGQQFYMTAADIPGEVYDDDKDKCTKCNYPKRLYPTPKPKPRPAVAGKRYEDDMMKCCSNPMCPAWPDLHNIIPGKLVTMTEKEKQAEAIASMSLADAFKYVETHMQDQLPSKEEVMKIDFKKKLAEAEKKLQCLHYLVYEYFDAAELVKKLEKRRGGGGDDYVDSEATTESETEDEEGWETVSEED